MLLAVVQGVAEFLPISSSGHIVILAELLAEGDASQFDVSSLNIVLHLGTLASILVVYWRRVMRLLGEDRRLVGLLAAGTVPAVAIGLPLKKWAPEVVSEFVLESPLVAGFMLLATGGLLLWIHGKRDGKRGLSELTFADAVAIGFSQAAAILPGLSRSGSTITCGLARDLRPEAAATFSFLLAIPVIAGAGLLEIKDQWELLQSGQPNAIPAAHLCCGAATSFAVGLAALWWLLKWLESGRLAWFAGWCIPAGVLVIVWRLWAS